MDVAAADADRIDGDLHVARPDLGRKIDLPQRENAFFLEHQCLLHAMFPSDYLPRLTELAGEIKAAICRFQPRPA
jgi:hypothetical protein